MRLPDTPDDQPGDNRHRDEKADDDKNKRIYHTAPPFRIPLHYTATLAANVPLPIMEAPRRTGEFVASAYHAEALRTLARVEGALGHEREAAGLRERWEAVRGAVAAEYVSTDGPAMLPRSAVVKAGPSW